MKVFLMMGQSNMAGRGDPADVAPLPSTHAFVLRCGRWQPMTEPLNIDRPADQIFRQNGHEQRHRPGGIVRRSVCGAVP